MFKRSKVLQLMLIGGVFLPFYLNAGSMDESAADTRFGTNGKVLELLSNRGGARHKAILVQEDDNIIVAGNARDANGDTVLALYKYLPNGSRDLTFGIDGASYADHVCIDWDACNQVIFPRGGENANGIMLQSDGKIIVTMTQDVSSTYDPFFGVARFNADGTLDTTYGPYSGYSMLPSDVYGSVAVAGTIQSDDKVLVVGSGRISDDEHGLMLSRFNTDGTVDTGFANQGTFYTNTNPERYPENGNDVAVQADGKILVVGVTYVKGCEDDTTASFMRGSLIRLNPDGSLDSTFDGDGILKFNIYDIFDVADPWNTDETNTCRGNYLKSVKVQPDGKIVVLGIGYSAAFVARFNSNGSIDTSFGYQGARMVYRNYDYTTFDHLNTNFTYVRERKFFVENMMLGKEGNIVASGYILYDDDAYHAGFLAMHLTSNGSFDTRYGTIGDARVDVSYPDESDFLYGGATAYALAEQSDGKVLLAGHADSYDNPDTAVLTRTVKVQETAIAPIIMYLLN